MARSFTLGTLVTRAKERADLGASLHISDAEWKGYISTAYGQLYSILVSSGMRHFEKIFSFTSDSLVDSGNGGGYTTLPSDFYSCLAVEYKPTVGSIQELYELMFQERNAFSGVTAGGQGQAFAILGPTDDVAIGPTIPARVVIFPKPPAGQTYRLLYVPQPKELSAEADGTSLDMVSPDGEDYLIWTAAMFALTKEESDTSVCERYREAAKNRLEEEALKRQLMHRRRIIVDNDIGMYDEGDWRFGR